MKNNLVPVRFSHLLGFAGIGSVVRSERYLYTICDTREWPTTYPIPYLERVRCALELHQHLHEPPIGNENSLNTTLPGLRFPSWMRCSKCESMYWRPWNQEHDIKVGPCCTNPDCGGVGKVPLDQYPWVLIDSEGRMDDVPWHLLLHGQSSCKPDPSKASLKIRENNTGDRWTLTCLTCGLESKRDDYLSPDTALRVKRSQPWLASLPPVRDDQDVEVKLVDISYPGIYSAPMCSALVIPPESRVQRGSVIDMLYRNGPAKTELKSARNLTRRRQIVNRLARKFHCSEAEIVEAWNSIDQESGYPLYGETFTPGQMQEDEFEALRTLQPHQREDEDLVTFSRTGQWRSLISEVDAQRERSCIHLVDELIEIKRLREIRVFKGFRRLGGPPQPVPPDIEGVSDWLPAIELFGEGIFLVFSESTLKSWEQQPELISIAREIQARFQSSGLADQVRENGGMQQPPSGRITPRFIFLHTLSHMLIRQFENSAGYPASSLKERIFCGDNMAGILIYVAVPDVAGSLGGLSELAQPKRFLNILSETFKKADWCSMDPVCSEHEEQGPHQLNRAACHGCALIPESACVAGNEILDRNFVKGNAFAEVPEQRFSSPLAFVTHE